MGLAGVEPAAYGLGIRGAYFYIAEYIRLFDIHNKHGYTMGTLCRAARRVART